MRKPKPNSNCLEGFRCPECGYEFGFYIDSTSTFEVEDNGTGDHQDVYWEDSSFCACRECSHEGLVLDFWIDNQEVAPDVKCLPLDTVEPSAEAVAALVYNELLKRDLTTKLESERAGGIKDIFQAITYTSSKPLQMCSYLEKLADWACDDEIHKVFMLLPHFKYRARRAERAAGVPS